MSSPIFVDVTVTRDGEPTHEWFHQDISEQAQEYAFREGSEITEHHINRAVYFIYGPDYDAEYFEALLWETEWKYSD